MNRIRKIFVVGSEKADDKTEGGTEKVAEKFEDILTEIGDWNRYQKLRLLAVVFIFNFICAAPSTVIFLSTVSAPHSAANRTKCGGNNFVYGDYPKQTMTTEFDLVCDKSYVGSLMLTIAGAVQCLGIWILISIPDLIGRKSSLLLVLILYIVSGTVSAFMPSIASIVFMRSVVSMTQPSTYYLPLFLILEFVGIPYRTAVNVLFASLYGITAALVALLAHLIHSWRHYVLATVAPALPLLIFYFWLDESPRWLLTRGRIGEARKALLNVARTNQRPISAVPSEKALHKFALGEQERIAKESEKYGRSTLLDLLRTKKLLIQTLVLIYIFSCTVYIYTGLNFMSDSLGSDPYFVTIILSLIEVPGGLLGFSAEKFGRIVPAAIFFSLSGLLSLGAGVSANGPVAARVVPLVFSKLCVTAEFQIIIQLVQELSPTGLRGQSQALINMAAGFFGVAAPFLILASKEYRGLAELVFAFMGISSGLLLLLLPETIGKPLPDTIDDALKSRGVGLASLLDNFCLRSVRQHWQNQKTRNESTPRKEVKPPVNF